MQAMHQGEAFDIEAGLPVALLREQNSMTWYEQAVDYIDMKWRGGAGKSRISVVETLTAVTAVLVRSDVGAPGPPILRKALRRWAFSPPRRNDDQPPEIRAALAWVKRGSLPVASLCDDKVVRKALDTLANKLDGTPAAPDYLGRRRRVFYNALKYAVREKRLQENPLDTTDWEAPRYGRRRDQPTRGRFPRTGPGAADSGQGRIGVASRRGRIRLRAVHKAPL